MRSLQWGHGISAMESIRSALSHAANGSASMGPRHLCHGIIGELLKRIEEFQSFNGATASLPWNQ
ncbi:MAG: hypothetical protein OJF51_000166 [Nitrospira sp.]|nr:MAG: hypothetical protein OJF51_000166 [Nitrospira sp.]